MRPFCYDFPYIMRENGRKPDFRFSSIVRGFGAPLPPELANLLIAVLTVLQFAIIGRALLSWFDRGARNPISQILIQITEPFIAPIRSLMPRTGMIDFSPLVALFIIIILQTMIRSAAT